MPTPVWISLGSNLGDRRAILEAALVSIAQVPGLIVRAVSSFHETKPVGGPPGQGPFLNAAAHLETSLDPYQLLAELQQIENQAGRVRVVRWGERTLDLDILIFGTKFLDTSELKLPHPRLAFRRFVLAPLAEIASQIVDTMTKRTIADLLANLDRKPRLLALEGPKGSLRFAVFEKLLAELPAHGIAETDLSQTSIETPEGGPDLLKSLESKIETLRPENWALEIPRFPWVVTDFSLAFDFRQAFSANWWNSLSTEGWQGRKLIAHKKRMILLEESAKTVQAMLVVVLVSENRQSRKPGMASIPQLWPESNEPEAIVAEIIATCRGIEGI